MSSDEKSGAGPLETREIKVIGMTCDHCARRVDKALRGVDGVREVRVNRPAGTASVTFEPGRVAVESLGEAVRKLGFQEAV